MENLKSSLQRARLNYKPQLPPVLKYLNRVSLVEEDSPEGSLHSELQALFPALSTQPILHFKEGQEKPAKPLKVGVVLSGGQAPGGHNVIAGLFDALYTLHPDSTLIGFYNGIDGLLKNAHCVLTAEMVQSYRNQGGFDIIGSGRTKIKTNEQFILAQQTVLALDLDGLIIIGGDDSNTNAAFLAEFFKSQQLKLSVIGVPKTIDGDLKNRWIEVSFGFDTASKIYSEIIGNLLVDCLSSKKYYFFIKLMGRSASHIALECALQTHPNLTLISEESAAKNESLSQIVSRICDMICKRSEQGKNYGAVLIPEGLIEFIPDCQLLIREVNEFFSKEEKTLSEQSLEEKKRFLSNHLTEKSRLCFEKFPSSIQDQLLLERDSHGNIQVSKIETERFFIELVKQELQKRQSRGAYSGTFDPQPLFCGYEGRSGLPSNFDCNYCYTLGQIAALLVRFRKTGYMSCVQQLRQSASNWSLVAIPLTFMLHLEAGQNKKAVIQKSLVDLEGNPFRAFSAMRDSWQTEDDYISPGPIQFFGPQELSEATTLTLEKESLAF